MNLSELKAGQSGKIIDIQVQGELKQHFLDMGIIPGVIVTVVKLAPMGDPMELYIRGYELTIRLEDAKLIEVEE